MNAFLAINLLRECESSLVDAIYYADRVAAENEMRLGLNQSGHRVVANRLKDLRERIKAELKSGDAA